MKLLLVAEESAGIQVLRMLAESGHPVAGVLTAPPTRGGGATVESVARGLGLDVIPSKRVRDAELAGWIRAQEVDLLLNVHSLFVAHPEVVAAPRIGSFNLHPGPLPEYAGLNAPSWAIYHGESRHAVTVHWMDPEIDTGPIAYEHAFDITDADTGLTVSTKCVKHGLPLLARLLDDAGGSGAIPALEQDLRRRRYYGREVPQEGKIVWSRPAKEVVDFVRACDYLPFPSPWGQPVARLDGQEVAILKASRTGERAGDEPPGTIGRIVDGDAMVAAGDEWILVHRIRLGGTVVDAAAALEPARVLEDGS